MKTKTKKPAAKVAKKKVAAKPAAPVAVTLRVYPHVMQTDLNGTEAPHLRILTPSPAQVENRKADHERAGCVVSVENYDAQNARLP